MHRRSALLFLCGLGLLFVEMPWASAAGPPLPVSCRVRLDNGFGDIQIRNEGTARIPSGSMIQWQTSTAKSGTFKLLGDVDPGSLSALNDNASFPFQWGVDNGATCVAVVASHPPIAGVPLIELKPQSKAQLLPYGSAAPATVPVGKESSCKFCTEMTKSAPSPTDTALASTGAQAGTSAPGTGAQQRFATPTGPHGQRLYACETLDGKTCGQPVAAAFCQQRGFAHAGTFDTSRQKMTAETLAGETCTKKKCQVFDFIACLN